MARNRSIYQSFSLYVGPSPATGAHTGAGVIKQLHRLQSLNYDWSYQRNNVNVLGQLASVAKDSLESPIANMPFTYYLTDLENEANLGFVTTGGISCLSSILTTTQDEKNYFILMTPEGVDAIGQGGAGGQVIGLGNGTINSYSIEASVGNYPTVSVGIQGLNLRSYANGVAQNIPAVDPLTGLQVTGVGKTFTIPTGTIGSGNKPFILKPGDITVDLSSSAPLIQSITGLCVQSFNISFDLNRDAVQCLGTKFAKARLPAFPVDINFSVDVLGNELNSASVADFICNTGTYTSTITLRQPNCTGGQGSVAVVYTLRGLALNGESTNLSVGPAQTATINWVGQISASGDVLNGLIMSGISSY